jgi:DNA-binding transcriptional regulator YiaG
MYWAPTHGVLNRAAKLNDDKVREIRRNLANKEATRKELAALYRVSEATIHNIETRRTWSHVK